METKGLLETLAINIGCSYLSELHTAYRYREICREIVGLDMEKYSIREWNDAVGYITGEKVIFSSPKEARAYLLERISQERNL
ncbi:MAG: hypothetical protein UDG86_06140 [Lachnospiraceae bacterium]|nr:hypothetical protein [Lachnospiraceae bacterium]